MNHKQKIVIWIAISIITIMGLFPPWVKTISNVSEEKPAGYSLIFAPRDVYKMGSGPGIHLDVARLLVQWAMVILVAGGIILVFKDRREE